MLNEMFTVMQPVLKSPFVNLKISYCVRLRKSESKKTPDLGIAYLQFIQGRKPRKVPLGIEWPLDKFNTEKNQLTPRWVGDDLVNDYNLILEQALARVTELMVTYRLKGEQVTLDRVIADYLNFESKDSVTHYFTLKATQLKDEGQFGKRTFLLYEQSIKRIIKFEVNTKKKILFKDLKAGIGTTIYRHCRDQLNLAHNTSVLVLKHFKRLLRLAIKDKYHFDHEALKVSTTYQNGFFEALTIAELKRLHHVLCNPEDLTAIEQECLRKFLFSCYSGLRISDNRKIHYKDFSGNRLQISVTKGAGIVGKKLTLELPDAAMELIEGRKGLIFRPVSDKHVNEALKKCAEKADINKRITFHVARNTFGTILVELGCDPFTLKDLLGHSSLADTQKYVKAGEVRKENLLKRFDKL